MDKDLLFLAECRNDDLQTLADYLVYDPKDKKKRFNEPLSDTRNYQIYYPHAMKNLVIEISNGLSYYGSNDIAYWVRGVFGKETAEEGLDALTDLIQDCGLPTKMGQLKSRVEITPELLRRVADTCNLIKTGPRQLSRDEIYDLLVECL